MHQGSPLTFSLTCSHPCSRRSWVTFASPCVTSPLLENSPSVFWRLRTWRKWTWVDCQVLCIHRAEDQILNFIITLSDLIVFQCSQCGWISCSGQLNVKFGCSQWDCSAYESAPVSTAIRSSLLCSRADAAVLTMQQLTLPLASALAPSVGALQHCSPHMHVQAIANQLIVILPFFPPPSSISRSLCEN